jgi:eukaryotic-like serine/threonine-protein kinase
MRPQVGQFINNKYRLIRLIGDGGMGSVYEAQHEVLGSTVALKFLHAELSRRQGLVQRFLQEARVSAKIQSPHVVRVTDVDQTSDGAAFIVLEYLEGRTLQTLYEDLYRAGKRLTYADALEYAMQMLEGVEAAHRAGIVHRDLKPDNVMITLTHKGQMLLKLLDFGIAKLKVSGELDRGLTRPGVVMGTPEYMAPEQAYSADAVDGRADIFSLGVMIFEMLAGRRPVGGDDPQQIASAYLSGRVSNLAELIPGVAPELAAAVHKAMAPLAKDRFATVTEMSEAIEPFAAAVRPAPLPRSSSVALSNPGAGPSMPGAGPSNPGMALSSPGVHPSLAAMSPPPATNAGQDGYRAVPKTLPPEDGPPPPAQQQASWGTPQLDLSPRPGGTAFGPPMNAGRGGGTVAEAIAPGTASGFTPGSTSPMDPYAPVVGGVAPAMRPSRGGRTGTSLALILVLAAGVAGSVVGGLYLAHAYATNDDHKDDPPVPLPPAPATVAPAPTTPPPSTTQPTPSLGPTRPIGPRPPIGPHPPGPGPSARPSATTAPTGPLFIPPCVQPGTPLAGIPGVVVCPAAPAPGPSQNPGPSPAPSGTHPPLIPIRPH